MKAATLAWYVSSNAELKNWRILRKIRSSPAHAGLLVNAVQTLITHG